MKAKGETAKGTGRGKGKDKDKGKGGSKYTDKGEDELSNVTVYLGLHPV